jgi:large-conductance mechanosensitive channel
VNKLLYIAFLLTWMTASSQDSLVVDTTTVAKIIFTEKDIQIDSLSMEARSFETTIKEKYKSDEFVYEQKVSKENWWSRFKEWLSDFFRRLFNFSSDDVSMKFVEVLIKVLAVLLIVFVIYLIVKAIMNGEGQWIFGKSSDKKVIHHEDVEKNIHLIDFEKLIKDTLKSGEKRLSIRYYYLWLLKKMAEKNIIEWDVEKTNTDYLYEIKEETFKTKFAYVSYLYNYSWYGEFELDEETFLKAKAAFEKTIHSI